MQPLDLSETITTLFSANSGKVSDVSLNLRRQEDVQTLSVSFFYELEKSGRTVDFVIQPLPCKKTAEKISTVIDLYPLNGTIKKHKFKIADLVRDSKKDPNRTEIKLHAEILNGMDCKEDHLRCVVIDFKDTNKPPRYDNLKEISEAETAFSAFFKGNCPSDKVQAEIYTLFKNCRVDFVINEGSLKATLLKKVFSPEQSEFFQDPGNEKGSQLLCQLCEVIMNGFKQGRAAVAKDCLFNPNDYISFINEKKDECCEGGKLPPIRLITLYPSCYYETYSINSAYYQLIKNIFSTNHEERNNTTIITIK